MKDNKVFKAFIIVITIITVLFATGTFAQASVPETGNNCLRASMQIRTHVRINTYSRSRGSRAQSSWIHVDDLNSPSELFSQLFDADQKGNLTDVLVSTYTASLAFSNEAYKFMFNKLLEGDAPLLFHCSNGKDRTGVAAMLILLALGVSEEIAKADYLQSNVSRKQRIDRLMKQYDFVSSWMAEARSLLTMIEGVLPESADMMMTEIKERYGTYENFMEKEYGLDEMKLRTFRNMYLE